MAKEPFFWQDEYGVFSFDKKRLPNYIAYVNRQKEHHAQGTLIPILEQTGERLSKVVQESAVAYLTNDTEWWHEMEMIDI